MNQCIVNVLSIFFSKSERQYSLAVRELLHVINLTKIQSNYYLYQVDGLIPGHEYKFRVKAINKEGESEPLETFGAIVAKDPFSKFYRLCINLHLLHARH